ncbi:MAG TPA: peptide ABC transporter substrate-binding protein [Pyrinomonadaceae bacterium]|nr:peptide ABC transporter substrate-binding protein [Pyrinomonadaceae bacterium]
MKYALPLPARSARLLLAALFPLLALATASCVSGAARSEYFGKTDPPEGQVLRYITGSEPESLDPQVSSGQPEARIYMALFEGLVEYHPKTLEPIPGVAESWEPTSGTPGYVFRLRRNARWSDGSPVTAHDFVYSIRRGLSPALASRSASFGYYIKYAQAYNEGGAFVRDPATGQFLLAADFAAGEDTPAPAAPSRPTAATATTATTATGAEPLRLTVAGDEKGRAKEAKSNPKLAAALAGKEFVPVRAEDVGVAALDDHTLRFELTQPTPFFVGVLAHPFFRPVPRQAVELHGQTGWTRPGRIITNGPFRLKDWRPYDEIAVERDPNYWDAAAVRLDVIKFYPTESNVTAMNLYKAGEVDAVGNHTVPISWLGMIRPLKDYMDAPEAAIEYYLINTKRPPMDDVRVRRAFNLALNKQAIADWRRIVKPLTAFTPEGIFPGYPQPRGDGFDPERARQLLAEAGYRDASGRYDPSKFPVQQVEITYNSHESVRMAAEFLQAQWKQNLGLTLPLRGVEFKTYMAARAKLDYKGMARGGWGADFMDPYAFLLLFYTADGNNGTGWHDPKFSAMLDEANRTTDPAERYEILARAEALMLEAQPVIPLWTPATNWVKKPYVRGMYPNAGSYFAWKYVYIEHDRARWNAAD